MESEGELSSFQKFKVALNPLEGRRGALMISVLVSGLSPRVRNLDRDTVLCTCAYSHSASLSTQGRVVRKPVSANPELRVHQVLNFPP